ncbi:putative PAS/PAC sensor protein [Haloterrigena turkmenica DSM 5511]|uniref:histidine kinase n=1 Tax=Haloterrigena turkmenica (strain ATCC 51198 / DSM 5511 / JCM 9101 / NCIMB 13204 / VKM B-1734 / 4k) TaxID=543526 RepID=D2RQU2_HALTV|nr:PAS domain-containing protein [Haloterrigena turkmenica]ADB60423.1 putative PAS/PAC sensor protein [Haloterrigena turkmenica DSM 5511]
MTLRSVPIVDRVTDAFFALDTDFRFTYVNERAETLLKRSREELIGRVMWDEFPQTVETQFPDGFHRAMDEQVPVSFEIYHAQLETWFEARAYPSESGLSVYMRDVTDRKVQETTLAQHAAVVEAVNDAVVTLDRSREIVTVNDATETALGIDRAELVGEHVERLIDCAGIAAEDAVEIGRAITDIDIGSAVERTLEVPFTDADGIDRIGEFRFVPIEDDVATVAAVIRDVTDRREYERVVTSLHEVTRWLLESDDPEEICAIAVHSGSDLLELPISGVWLLEEEHGYLDPVAGTAGAHDEFGGLPRFNPGEGLVWDVFESGDVERFDDLREVEDIYNPDTPIRSEIIAPIGTHGVLMTGSLEPHRFDETDVDLISTLVENTRAALDRADREQVLRERTAELERQTERLESVANVLSSDLKAQLSTVADALESDGSRTGTDGETHEEWEFPLAEDSVEATLDRAEGLVDDIREFARNASTVGTRSRITLESAIDEALERSRLDYDSVVVEEPATLRADPDRFVHLLETAFDDAAARADSEVTIQVGLVGFENDDRSRGFFLHDDAAEIPPAAHERVLDPTTGPDGVETGDAVATDGLGLALVRAIAEAHDWELSIDNGENGGTRLEVRDVTTLERDS